MIKIKTAEFNKIKNTIYDIAGIQLKPEKISLVENRLAKRIRLFHLKSYNEYYEMAMNDAKELQVMVNLLTTNETSFFREMRHFDFLKEKILPQVNTSNFRVWSAACSNGAEGYSIAMVLDEYFSKQFTPWEILLSDINEPVVEKARLGVYPMRFADNIAQKYLKKYCLKGVNAQEGSFLIKEQLKTNMSYTNINLNTELSSDIGEFDVIFLRNILIYFDNDKKREIVENVVTRLKKGGYLFIGHSETLNKITDILKLVQPTVYIKE